VETVKYQKSFSKKHSEIPRNMKIVRKSKTGETREVLLKEYFINASLIALLKRVGLQAASGAAHKTKSARLARVQR
jgi:polynucleotide 5'-kinase involved in rRNA processing